MLLVNSLSVIIRKQNPAKKSHWRYYKPFLRIDFRYRCAYCQIHEAFWGTQRNFVVEHFRPRDRFPLLILEYSNLYYACNKCNGSKWDIWPSDQQIAKGLFFVDPCREDLYARHVRIRSDGSLEPLTRCGAYTVEHLRLYRKTLRICREQRLSILREIRRSRRLIRALGRKIQNANQAERDLYSALMDQILASLEIFRGFFRPQVPTD